VLVADLTGIDNDATTLGSARFGLLSLKVGAAGVVHMDRFELRTTHAPTP
jgi:hypothetical protein